MNETAMRLLSLILPFLLALAACTPEPAAEPPLKGAKMGGEFTLTDHDGRTVTDRDFGGKYRLVYFGFTHCPNICPTDLATIGAGLRAFEKEDADRAARIQPLFITVDPERDTPAVMKRYAAAFHPRIVGLTGTPEQIADVAKKHAIYYAKDPPQPGGGYNVNHYRVILLFGPQGEPIAALPHEEGAEALAAELDRWVR